MDEREEKRKKSHFPIEYCEWNKVDENYHNFLLLNENADDAYKLIIKVILT